MHIVKINRGNAELCDSSFGSYIRTLASGGVIDADINDEGLVLITYDDGRVEIKEENGRYIRTLRSMSDGRVVCARWNDEDIAMRLIDGRTELRKEDGAYIRTF